MEGKVTTLEKRRNLGSVFTSTPALGARWKYALAFIFGDYL
jgi:hypothetical protein